MDTLIIVLRHEPIIIAMLTPHNVFQAPVMITMSLFSLSMGGCDSSTIILKSVNYLWSVLNSVGVTL